MISPPLIFEDNDNDEYAMEGSCRNKVKFGKFGGVVEEEDTKEATGSSKHGAMVNGGRVSKRFRGIELVFMSEDWNIEVDWFFSFPSFLMSSWPLNFAGL